MKIELKQRDKRAFAVIGILLSSISFPFILMKIIRLDMGMTEANPGISWVIVLELFIHWLLGALILCLIIVIIVSIIYGVISIIDWVNEEDENEQ